MSEKETCDNCCAETDNEPIRLCDKCNEAGEPAPCPNRERLHGVSVSAGPFELDVPAAQRALLLSRSIAEAVARERERIAKVVENFDDSFVKGLRGTDLDIYEGIAAAIRGLKP